MLKFIASLGSLTKEAPGGKPTLQHIINIIVKAL